MIKKGFTIFELLIVIAIGAVLLGSVGGITYTFFSSAQTREAEDQVMQYIQLAQTRTKARLNGKKHGVYIAAKSITVYRGASYQNRESGYDMTYSVDDGVSLSVDVPNDDIQFSLPHAFPITTGTVRIIHADGTEKQVLFNEHGTVYVQ